MAGELFEYGCEIGYKMTLLDIGGGFLGEKDSKDIFQQLATAIKTSLHTYFNKYPQLKVIAEPGWWVHLSLL